MHSDTDRTAVGKLMFSKTTSAAKGPNENLKRFCTGTVSVNQGEEWIQLSIRERETKKMLRRAYYQ